MAKNIRIGIVRARHTSDPVIPDSACIAMLLVGDYSVFRYWANTTRGYLDFNGSPMFGWVDIALGSDTSRSAQASAAVAALRARDPSRNPLAGLNGLIVLTHPGQVTVPNPKAAQPGEPATITIDLDGGKTSVAGLPVAVLPVVPSDHTFMCHELGHVLGFDHTFGLRNNGTDWAPDDATIVSGPEYGSPYDLMSSASFGTRGLGNGPRYTGSPVFIGPSVIDWPSPGAFSMGPHLARANLHHFMPEALAGRFVEHPIPAMGGKVTARLVPASASQGKCLLILKPTPTPSNGLGVVYVEYRTAQGWDRGLDLGGPDLAREAVVVHVVENAPAKGPRVWYRGAVPTLSPDRDVQVIGSGLVVTVDGVDPDGRWADVSVSLGAAPQVKLEIQYVADDFVGGVGHPRIELTPCGDQVRVGDFATATTTDYAVSYFGIGGSGPPNASPRQVAWTVGGQALSGTGGTVWVTFDGSTFQLEYFIDPIMFGLRLMSRGGERLRAPVGASVGPATATSEFVAQGWDSGVYPEDLPKVLRCLSRELEQLRWRTLPKFRKPTPDPKWKFSDRRLLDISWFEGALLKLREIDTSNSRARHALRRLIELQMSPVPTLQERLAAIGIIADEASDRDPLREGAEFEAIAEGILSLAAGRPADQRMVLPEAVELYQKLLCETDPILIGARKSRWTEFFTQSKGSKRRPSSDM